MKKLVKKKKKHKLSKADQSKGGKKHRRVRLGSILTDAQGEALIKKAYEVAMAGDTVLLKSLLEQKYGRPVSTVSATVDTEITIVNKVYGTD